MTSLTSLGLPYQQATDRPCDAPATWCNFTSTVETQLVAIDNILGRISPAVPAAKVRRSTSLSITANQNVGIPFESTVYDTDNMVNLANSPTILPHRLGRYIVSVTLQNITTSFSGSNLSVTIALTTGPVVADLVVGASTYASAASGWSIALGLSTGSVVNDNWFKVTGIVDWTSGDSQGWGVLVGPGQTGNVGLVELSAVWVSDLHAP